MLKRIVIISDTHEQYSDMRPIPAGDILIHAGDFTKWGRFDALEQFNEFLGQQPHPHKIVIAGNHDFCMEQQPAAARQALSNAIYLQDEAITIDGIKLYGSPWQVYFKEWAFFKARGPEVRAMWDLIPNDTDLLITHGPPFGFGDQTLRRRHIGDHDLRLAVERVRPRVHAFGHIHESAGRSSNKHTTFINASLCDMRNKAINAPQVFTWKSNP